MKIDIKDIITLSDDLKYIVVSKTIYNDLTYYFLTEENNIPNIKILYTKPDNENLFLESEDKEINTILMPIFVREAKKAIPDLFKNFKELDDIVIE